MYIQQKSDFWKKIYDILEILLDFYANLHNFLLTGSFHEADPDPPK